MKADAVVKQEGLRVLINTLGYVDAERFIVLINKEPFNYTEWRRNHLDQNMSVRELSAAAEAYSAKLRD
ncbi:MAG: hypothetical protein IKX21_05910 [Deltaproteobacteria bacterium]|nr:hypothetical protein [Deltaproteobacteria bacterium]